MPQMHRGERQVKFSPDHHAIMWISTKGLLKEHERKIVRIIRRHFKGRKIIFIGYCLGRFDLIVEFEDESAKVTSQYVCSLQDKIEKSIAKSIQENNSVCSSLTISNKIIKTAKRKDSLEDKPLRIYTFLRPKVKKFNLDKIMTILEDLDRKDNSSSMELLWNSSSFSFILTSVSDVFQSAFSKIIDFRRKTKKYFAESSTYVGLRWGPFRDKKMGKIRAITFVKLKNGHYELNLTDREKRIWTPLFADNAYQLKRLGWTDIALGIKVDTIKKLKSEILKLRDEHYDAIFSTSTLILPKG